MVWLVRDVRHGMRVLLRNPGFTLASLLTLTIGIGANTAIFSVVNAVLLRPLPYPDPGRIVLIARSYGTVQSEPIASDRKFLGFRARMRTLQDMSAYDFGGPGLNLAGGDIPERLKAIKVSQDYFRLFGAETQIGRTFTSEEDRPRAPHAVVLSDGIWRRRFGGDLSILGRAITLSGESYTVVGVLKPGFVWDPQPDIWIPLQANPNDDSHVNHLIAAARLRPGVSFATANAELKRVADEFRAEVPGEIDPAEANSLLDFQREMNGDVRPALTVLAGAVFMVLLIACANVANLMLARATARQKEMAIRAAVGADSLEIVRQLIVESVLLALAGAILGTVLAHFGVRALLGLNPEGIHRAAGLRAGVALDGTVLLFTFLAALFTGFLFGLFPAIQSSRVNLHLTLKEAAGRSGSGFRQNRARGALVVAEMALAVMLLSGAALLIRSFLSLRSVDPGVVTRNVLTMETSLAGSRYKTTSEIAELSRNITERLGSSVDARGISTAMTTPIDSMSIDMPFSIAGRKPTLADLYNGDSQFRFVGASYFDVFRIPVLRGRAFASTDGGNSEPVAIVNQAFAKQYFRGEDPIGASIRIGQGTIFDNPNRRIVGVVGDVSERGIRRGKMPILYIPTDQVPDRLMSFVLNAMPLRWVLRSPVDPASMARTVQRIFKSADPKLAVANLRTMDAVSAEAMSNDDFNTVALTVFAGVALLLAALGIYGVMSYTVAQRTHEIGIRAALGASRADTWRLVASQGMGLALIGLLIGSVASFATSRLLGSLLYGVHPTDPLTFTAMGMVLALTALAACSLPAWRAMRVDPLEALRWE